MSWLRHEKDDLYDPSSTDMLRVAFISQFKRGRLERGLVRFMRETDFRRFIMRICSAGFVNALMIRSQNALNFAYVIYLVLRDQAEKGSRIKSLVRRWFDMCC